MPTYLKKKKKPCYHTLTFHVGIAAKDGASWHEDDL